MICRECGDQYKTGAPKIKHCCLSCYHFHGPSYILMNRGQEDPFENFTEQEKKMKGKYWDV